MAGQTHPQSSIDQGFGLPLEHPPESKTQRVPLEDTNTAVVGVLPLCLGDLSPWSGAISWCSALG